MLEHRQLDSSVSTEETGTSGWRWWTVRTDEAAVRHYRKLFLRFSLVESEAVDSSTSSRQTGCIWTAIRWEDRREAGGGGEAEAPLLVVLELLCGQRRA